MQGQKQVIVIFTAVTKAYLPDENLYEILVKSLFSYNNYGKNG